MTFWKKKTPAIVEPEVPEPSALSGIEKMALEASMDVWLARQAEYEERRAADLKRIADLESQIAPQMQELAMLRVKYNGLHYAQSVAYSQPLSQSSLLSLLGGTAASGQGWQRC